MSLNTCKPLKNVCKYITQCPPTPCKPVMQIEKTVGTIQKDTIYKSSYQEQRVRRCQPIMPTNQIEWKSAGQFQEETVQKMSYRAHCSPMVQKILPKDHCLGNKGPMRFMTSQRHDFYTPCGEREKNIKSPPDNLKLPGGPMAKLTTNNLSYQPQCASPAKNFRPVVSYNSPSNVMDFNTVNRSSFQNVGMERKMENPWVVKPVYCKPVGRMDCCTVYNLSYKYPCENLEVEYRGKTPDRKAHQFE